MTKTRFLPINLFCQSFCISMCLDYDHLSNMAQTLKILIDAYTCRIVRGQSTQKDVCEKIEGPQPG